MMAEAEKACRLQDHLGHVGGMTVALTGQAGGSPAERGGVEVEYVDLGPGAGAAWQVTHRVCPVQPKVASSGLRLRVILRSPELPCESLAGSGRAGGMSCVTALAARVAGSRSGT